MHVEAHTKTFNAEADLSQGQLVKLGAAAGGVAVCGAGEEPIGSAVRATKNGDSVAVRLLGGGLGTHTLIADAAIAANAAVYSAAAGEAGSTPAGSIIGYAPNGAGGAGELFELLKRGVV